MNQSMFTRRDAILTAAIATTGIGLSGCRRPRQSLTFPMGPQIIDPQTPLAWQAILSGDQGPGPRSRHGLVYDRAAKTTVLFGGVISDGEWTTKSDTWELRQGAWNQVKMTSEPPSRHRGAMAYDAARANSVLFGGQGNRHQFLSDTWLYKDQQWRQSAAGPSPRCGHVMAFDEAAAIAVLFGGVGPNKLSLGDTWQFDGTGWRTIPGAGPPARRYAAFAYDPDLKGCVLHGGSDDESGQRGFGDAWLFRNGAWTRMANGYDTEKRDDHGLAYHVAAKKLIMLEGLAGKPGLLVRDEGNWRRVAVSPTPPRHQCSPLAWDDGLNGLVMHGGETHHAGPQHDATWVLRFGA